jgi:glutathione synthase/RimK-type ligase-like ATP-grasp enzyme
MILIITHKQDFTTDYLVNKLNQQNVPYKRLNCEDIMASGVRFSCSSELSLSILGKQKFSSVWFRRTSLPALDVMERSNLAYIHSEFDSLLKNLFSIIDAKWISDPWQVYRAENKLYQLKIAIKIGFKIPQTLVTTDRIEVSAFYERVQKMIVKPISVTRSNDGNESLFIYTSRVEQHHIDNLDDFDLTPCIFQEEIEKELELRVTVVGRQVFAASVNSQQSEETKVDWRRKPLKFEAFELPKEVADKCVRLVKRLGLLFGAIDLILSPNGSFTFLEINPNGQWVWIENETALPISDAIIYELTNNVDDES